MRIVVAQTSFLGDVVLSTPVFAVLKRRLPGVHVTVWVRPEGAEVLRGHQHVDAVLIDDKRGGNRGVRGFLRQRALLRQGKFDLALALHKSLRTALLLTLARVPRRIGFRQSTGWFLYHDRVERDASLHDVLRNLSILSGLMMDVPDSPALTLPVTAGAGAQVMRLLQEAGIPAEAPVVGLAPGSAWATKRWTAAGYADVAVALERDGYRVVLLGTVAEQEIAAEVNRRAGGIAADLAGRTDVATLVALLDRCQLLVCNDSAPMHIAVARGVPVVAVFGPTHPRQGYGPFSERAAVVQSELDCRPCSRHGGVSCPIGTHDCMLKIEAGAVVAAARSLLSPRLSSVSESVAS